MINISYDEPFDYSIFIPYNCGRAAITELHLTKHQVFNDSIKYDDIHRIVELNGYRSDNKSAIIGINGNELVALCHHDNLDKMYIHRTKKVYDYLYKTSVHYEDDDKLIDCLYQTPQTHALFILFELVQRLMQRGNDDKYSLWCGYDRIQLSESFYDDSINDNSHIYPQFMDYYNMVQNMCDNKWRRISNETIK